MTSNWNEFSVIIGNWKDFTSETIMNSWYFIDQNTCNYKLFSIAELAKAKVQWWILKTNQTKLRLTISNATYNHYACTSIINLFYLIKKLWQYLYSNIFIINYCNKEGYFFYQHVKSVRQILATICTEI